MKSVIIVIFLIISFILTITAGCTGSSAPSGGAEQQGSRTFLAPIQQPESNISPTAYDTDLIIKMNEMNEWISPVFSLITTSSENGDYNQLGMNAFLLRTYIDKNMQDVKLLANRATANRQVAAEYVGFLEDLRTCSDYALQAKDSNAAGNREKAANLLNTSISNCRMAGTHIERVYSLI